MRMRAGKLSTEISVQAEGAKRELRQVDQLTQLANLSFQELATTSNILTSSLDATAKSYRLVNQSAQERYETEESLLKDLGAATKHYFEKISDLYDVDVQRFTSAASEKYETHKTYSDARLATEAEASRQKQKMEEEGIVKSIALLAQLFPQFKGIALAQAIIATYENANKQLGLPFPLNIIAMGATIAAGLANVAKILEITPTYEAGGYTGDGSTNDIAGIVHRGEIVFESPIARSNKPELLALRTALQQGATVQGLMMNSNDNGSLIVAAEIRKLRNDLKTLQPGLDVVLQGTLSGQKFLRKELPRYQKVAKGKNL